MPRLYKRIAVAAMFHAKIPALIRTLEPHLSIIQSKELKKEGKYKGQREEYPKGIDVKAKPLCARYVRQLIIGVSDPGKKHRYIVERYIEEALKNMDHVEIVETAVLTRPICQILASKRNLKALRLLSYGSQEISPLSTIKTLRHLHLENVGVEGTHQNSVHSMLWNSKSTLKSLTIQGSMFYENPFQMWSGIDTTGDQDRFPALDSLSLAGIMIDDDVLKSMQRAIDFTGLRELSLAHIMYSGDDSLIRFLTTLASATAAITSEKGMGIHLQKLTMNLSFEDHMHSRAQSGADFKGKCQFLSSFDTLTELVLPEFGLYLLGAGNNDDYFNNGLLTNLLVNAITKHKKLKTLRISYNGIEGGRELPYFSAKTITRLISELPLLETFEFSPKEDEMAQIGKALANGNNLSTIILSPQMGGSCIPSIGENAGLPFIHHVLDGFLSHNDSRQSKDTFVWEDVHQLRRISIVWQIWDIASKFGKGTKGMSKPESREMSMGTEKRKVLFRNVTQSLRAQRVHVGYDDEYEWVKKVERKI